MDPAVREQVKRKFDISVILAKEHIPFLNTQLEERHRDNLGSTYKNKDSSHVITLLKAKDSSVMLA